MMRFQRKTKNDVSVSGADNDSDGELKLKEEGIEPHPGPPHTALSDTASDSEGTCRDEEMW